MTQIKPLLNWLCLQALLDSLSVSVVDIFRADFTQQKKIPGSFIFCGMATYMKDCFVTHPVKD